MFLQIQFQGNKIPAYVPFPTPPHINMQRKNLEGEIRKLLIVVTSEHWKKGYKIYLSLDTLLYYLILFVIVCLYCFICVQPTVSPVGSIVRSVQNQTTSLGLHCEHAGPNRHCIALDIAKPPPSPVFLCLPLTNNRAFSPGQQPIPFSQVRPCRSSAQIPPEASQHGV